MRNILLKWKIWRIERRLAKLLLEEGVTPAVWSFGAYYIDPKHLIFFIGVPTDHEKSLLKSNTPFIQRMRDLLDEFDWPLSARNFVVIDIESQETVDKDSGGHWWHHYK